MSEDEEADPRSAMPTERKSMWRTAEERRMSDLTRVLEWLERRRGKKPTVQKQKAKVVVPPKAKEKEEKKSKGILKHLAATQKATNRQSTSKEEDVISYRRLYGVDQKGNRLSMVPSNYSKITPKKSDLDIKDAIALESTQRPNSFRRQSSILDPTLQDTIFSNRKMTLIRDWGTKTPDTTYERKLKSLMEKGTEPKMETVKMLKPEEVLSCRYLRLSKNNIRTLLKLCKDAGLNMDIHPHMIESEIDSKKVFAQVTSGSL